MWDLGDREIVIKEFTGFGFVSDFGFCASDLDLGDREFVIKVFTDFAIVIFS